MSFNLLQGDCREVMRTMAADSVDAIVCDPPYELGFMGKSWDNTGVATDPRTWAEALRVAKPGAFLVAFGGTRTFHRLASAIEDAGWELRDSILRGHMPQPEDCPWLFAWGYASGFPKSHNLDTLRGDLICGCESPTEREVRPMREGDVSPTERARQERRKVLQQGMPQQGSSEAMLWPEPEESASAGPESGVEGRRDDLQEEGQLRECALRASASVGNPDGSEGRVCDGAPTADGGVVRIHADADGGGASHQPQPEVQPAPELGAVAEQQEPQTRGAWPVCRGCGKPILPRGMGTALKPAWEPIVVARKPLIGTVAESVIEHATGALNIDACRIETADDLNGGAYAAEGGREISSSLNASGMNVPGKTTGKEFVQPQGRWPANLVHDGSDEVLACFPDAPGQQADISFTAPSKKTSAVYGRMRREGEPSAQSENEGAVGFNMRPGMRRLDGGSAARFFYCAKASQEDRNEGCDQLPQKAGGMVSNTSGQHITRRDGGAPGPRANHHPTVKPTELMRWLVRLITPKNGLVLDPFTGSGSTGKAAVLEGRSFVGIDLSPEYIEIARARIEFAQRQGHQPSLLEAA